MSTKTLRKRIALVAVSALGFGLISVMPANAAITQTVSLALSRGTITAGAQSVTAVVTGTAGAAELAIRITTPSGAYLYAMTNAAVADSTGLTHTAVATDASTFTIATSALLDPGTYTITAVGGGAASDLNTTAKVDSAAIAATAISANLTVVSPASATAMAASMDSSSYGTGSTPTIRAFRATGSSSTGAIKFRVDVSPDLTAVGGTVFAATTGGVAGGSFGTYTIDGAHDDVAGTYKYTAWADANADGLVGATEQSAQVTFVLGGAFSATKSTLTISNPTVVRAANTTAGALGATRAALDHVVNLTKFTVTFTALDADGNAASTVTTPTVSESANLSDMGAAGAASALTRVGTSNVYQATFTASAVGDTTGFTTNTITLATDAEVATALTATYKAVYMASTATAGELSVADSTGVGSVTDGVKQTLTQTSVVGLTPTGQAVTVDPAVGGSLTYTYQAPIAAANQYILITRVPSAGTSLTNSPATSKLYRLGSDAKATWTETVTAATGEGYTVEVAGGHTATGLQQAAIAVTFATAAPTITMSPTATILAKYGATNAVSGTLTDQYGRAIASKNVVYSVSGRNISTGTVVTNASGTIPAITIVDTSASTVILSDVVLFTYNYTTAAGAAATSTGTRTVTYSATGPVVASIAISSPTTTTQIDQGKPDGVPARTVTYTATVRKADNTPSGAGILCTFTGGAGDLFGAGTGINTSVTDADGLCTITSYRDIAGTSSIKATAVGVTSAASTGVKWVNQSEAATATTLGENDARYIKVNSLRSTSGTPSTIVATVTDRWGNPVNRVPVVFSLSGVGRLVSGETTAKVTNVNGQAQIQVTTDVSEAGTLTITAAFSSVQADDLAGFVTVNSTVGTVGTAADGDTQTSTKVAGVSAAVKSASGTVEFATGSSVSNADVLKSIVALIASINKQIQALQKLILARR